MCVNRAQGKHDGYAICAKRAETGTEGGETGEVVEPSGIEPLTSCMPCRRSPS